MKPKFWFECGMITTFRPAFNKCRDNFEVEEVLRKIRVIKPDNKTNTGEHKLVVFFSSKTRAYNFIDRLNAYLSHYETCIKNS